MMKNLITTLIMTAALMGCATQGYDGPPKASSELSTIYFYSEGRLSVKKMAIDGIVQSVFDMGISVPAGQHNATNEYQLDMQECPMFSVGCLDEVILGHCSFNLTTEGGHDYGVELRGAGSAVMSRVYDKSNDTIVGTGECVNDKEDFHTSVLRRRSTIGK